MPRESRLTKLIQFDQDLRQTLSSSGPMNNRLPAVGMQLNLFPQRVRHIIGVDEVGRGCLAGPLVAGAVAFNAETLHAAIQGDLDRLDDSKQVTAKAREALAQTIESYSCCATGVATVDEINRLGVTKANELAMERAVDSVVEHLATDASSIVVVVDGRSPIDRFKYRQIAIVGADGKSASVAAASIIAKVHRDSLMTALATRHPEYGWADNKGYPAPAHLKAILHYGRTSNHRIGFGENANEQALPMPQAFPLLSI